jgi:transcriptional regulator GlxA family with amidase domain
MKAAFVVFDRMTSLDFIGFYDPVTRLKSMKIIDDFEWRICSTTQHVVDDRGLRMEADAVGEPLDSYDILFVPGGFGTRNLQHDRGFIDWLKAAQSVPLSELVITWSFLSSVDPSRGQPQCATSTSRAMAPRRRPSCGR